jgi:pimeloyl-ACP methyl ester carboxylesterase
MPGLDASRVRTLVACGEQGPNLPGAMRLAREISKASFERMPMTGHASILDRPHLVLSLIADFMGQLASRPYPGAGRRHVEES